MIADEIVAWDLISSLKIAHGNLKRKFELIKVDINPRKFPDFPETEKIHFLQIVLDTNQDDNLPTLLLALLHS